jgi:hypothetical protein
VALRSVAARAGVAIVPIAYLSARELLSRRAGLLAAAFVVVNPFMIWYSQEARSYMLLAALSGASFLCFIRARRDPSRRWLAWWAGTSALALMTHFFAGFLVAPEAVWLLWVARTRATVLAVGAVAAVQAAMLPFAIVDASPSRGAGWIAAIPRVNRVAQTVTEWGASNLYRRVTTPPGLIGGAALCVIVVALVVGGGDRRARAAAVVGATIAAFVFLTPLALSFLGQDYFLSRNEIPAFVPVVTALAAACVAPRARLGGAALAVALLAFFCFGAVDVQTHPYLQRPNWRDVASSLGPAIAPRAILAADGATADPLKIYLRGSSWTEPPARQVLVSEIDVVGATKRLRLVDTPTEHGAAGGERLETAGAELAEHPRGAPVPRSVSPPGATLVARFRVHNWIVARFALPHPERVSVSSLARTASRYFRRTPATLLIFIQPRER